MVGSNPLVKENSRDWLRALLCSEFFASCSDHQSLRKNEKNLFCMDCGVCMCRHCMKSHCNHRSLQICKYVYNDVVRLQDMQKHLDCSKIQSYKINGEKAVHLNPRSPSKPKLGDHLSPLSQSKSKDAKLSKLKSGGTCEACGKFLQDMPNRFCSIACKVSVVLVEPKEEQSHKYAIDLSLKDNLTSDSTASSISMAESSEEIKTSEISKQLKPRKVFHKRKGNPQRSPHF